MKIFAQRSTTATISVLLIAGTIGLSIAASAFAHPLGAPKPWVSTKLLTKSLDQFSELPITAGWANTTKQRIEAIAAGDQTPQQRIEHLKRLAQQHRSFGQIYQTVEQSSLPATDRGRTLAQLQQFNYQLARRIATWSAIVGLADSKVENTPESDHLRRIRVNRQWSRYLLLDDLAAAFVPSANDEKAKRLAARATLNRIYSPTLQATQANYLQSVFSTAEIQLLKSHASRNVDSSSIANRLELYESEASSRSGHLLNDVIQDLMWSDDPAYQHAAQVIDAHYRNANFRLTISEAFMNRLLPELPTIAEPVSETVQGARVSGRSRVTNQVNVALVPDNQQLNFQLQTRGHVQADTVARTKSFNIMNQGQANFQVYKQISVNANGIDTSQKAYATSSSNQFLVGISSKLDNVPLFGTIARKAAEKRVNAQSRENNQMFRRKVAQSAEIRVEEEITKQVEIVRQAANEKLLKPLVALDLEPTPMQLATTASEIVIRYRLAGGDQMAANTARPNINDQAMLGMQLHQSLLNNVIARLGLNGETFTSQELSEHMQKVLGVSPKAQPDSDQKDAIFKFAAFDPIRLNFEGNRVEIIINLDSLKVGKSANSIRRLSIKASYAIEADGMNVRLIQDEAGTRVTCRGKRLRLGDRAVISTVMKMLFEPSYTINALPKQFRNRPQAQSLVIARLVIHDGWLGVEMDDAAVLARLEQTPSNKSEPRIGENFRRFFDRRQ